MKLTARQELAQAILAGQATHCMLFGGSRSGKTFLLVRSIVLRAIGEDDRGLPLLIKAHEELHTSSDLEWEAKLCRHQSPTVGLVT